MASQLDLKQLERKAFRSTYQDGLWDIYIACTVIGMMILSTTPDTEDLSLLRILLALICIGIGYGLFWAGKKYLTLPRLGQVNFGESRLKRKRTLGIILGVIVAVQVAVLIFSIAVWASPELQSRLNLSGGGTRNEALLVAAIGAILVGPSTALIAYFNDFLRGYYIAVVLAVSIFLLIFLDQPLVLLVGAALIAVPGVVLFVRFLRKYRLPPVEAHSG